MDYCHRTATTTTTTIMPSSTSAFTSRIQSSNNKNVSSSITTTAATTKVRKTPEGGAGAGQMSKYEPPSSRRKSFQEDKEFDPRQFLPLSYYHPHSHPFKQIDSVDRILSMAVWAVEDKKAVVFSTDPFAPLSDDLLATCLCAGYLDSLEIWHTIRLVSKRFRNIADQFTRKLDLRKCRIMTNETVVKMPFIRLTSLDLSYCSLSATSLSSIAHLAPTLKVLRLKGTGITDADLRVFLDAIDSPHPSSLEELDLGVIRKEDSEKITDEILDPLSLRFPNLTRLSLAWCRRVTDAGLAVAMPRWSRLMVELDVSLTGITSESCHHLTNVHILDISATQVDDDGLEKLSSKSSSLSSIRLRFLSRLTSRVVRNLVLSSSKLTQLHMEHCGHDMGKVLTYPMMQHKKRQIKGMSESYKDQHPHLMEIDDILQQRRK